MIILVTVVALVFLAMRLISACIAAVLAVRVMLEGDQAAVDGHEPQDAPRPGLWDPVRGPQDAPRGPQDAPGPTIDPDPDPDPATGERVLARWSSAVAVVRSGRADAVLTELTGGRRMSLVIVVRDRRSGRPDRADGAEPAAPSRSTILDTVPRPLTGPAYLGGRDDAAYLRGWDDGVDWIAEGNPMRGPSWSSAAYMTGWNDAVRALAKARCGSPIQQRVH
jgi:hypothetical protein